MTEALKLTQLWRVPTLLVGMVLFSTGLYFALPARQGNNFPAAMDEVEALLEANQLEQAQQYLKEKLGPHIARSSQLDQARYEMLWGDLIYLQQREKGWDKTENHQKVLLHYRQSREQEMAFDGLHLQRLAETFVALRRDEEAMAVLDELDENQPARRRYLVLRRIIERRHAAGADVAEVAPLMARFDTQVRQETDTETRRAQQLWVSKLRADGLLKADEPQQAIEFLQRKLIHLMADGHENDLAPLWISLAKAYQCQENHEEARRWYMLAQQNLSQTDNLNADIHVGLGQIEIAQTGDVQAALEHFSIAEKQYPTATSYFKAILGSADCQARLGSHTESLERFQKAISLINENPKLTQQIKRQITEIVTSHYDFNTAREEHDVALDYLSVLRQLHLDSLPPQLLLEFARTHQLIAIKRRFDAQALSDVALDESTKTAQRIAYQEASVHFGKAGDFFLQHAHRMIHEDSLYSTSLWGAAVNYDDAQLWDQAIRVYSEFVKARPDDPRQLDARRRLGIAYLSDGQYAAAVDLFNELVEENPQSPEAYNSLVPLAKGHIALRDPDPAKRILEHVVTDHPSITPDSLEYREALIELGKVYYQQDEFESAIQYLTEAVDRYGRNLDGPKLRFRLADAYRQSADQMAKTLQDPMARSRLEALEAERARRLDEAVTIFGMVIEELEAKHKMSLMPVETLILRNSYIYRGDCAYSLGHYEQAIAFFDQAARRWEDHPASLVALVQIVNAYCELDQLQQAKVANDRARWQLQRIPEEAFNDPSLPMTREHWEDWLRWTSELNLFASQANPEPNPQDSAGVEQ